MMLILVIDEEDWDWEPEYVMGKPGQKQTAQCNVL